MKRSTPLKRKTALRKQSKKRKAEWPKYLKARKKFLENTPICDVGTCLSRPVDVHHMKGRSGPLLLDKRYWMAVCRLHHDWIHSHPNKARLMGLLQ